MARLNVNDDVSFSAVGGAVAVMRELAASFNQVAAAVQRMGLPISLQKAGILASAKLAESPASE